MKLKVGVMGSAQGPTLDNEENVIKAHVLGKSIADNNCILVNGACPGLPHEAAIGAKKAGGFVLGVSPAFSLREHVEKYKSPNEEFYDIILFTGKGLMERDITNIRSSDAIIIVGGGIGTLNEFTVAFEERKYIAILEGTHGISDHIKEIVSFTDRELDDRVIFDSDPKLLVEKLINMIVNGDRTVVEDQRVIGLNYFKKCKKCE